MFRLPSGSSCWLVPWLKSTSSIKGKLFALLSTYTLARLLLEVILDFRTVLLLINLKGLELDALAGQDRLCVPAVTISRNDSPHTNRGRKREKLDSCSVVVECEMCVLGR